MPFQPAPGIVEVAMRFEANLGYQANNILHFDMSTSPVPDYAVTDLLTALSQWALNQWAPLASDDWTLLRLDARDLSVENGAFDTQFPAVQGDLTNDMLPPDDTIAIRLNTGAVGRSRRGRVYFVGLGEGDIVDGDLLPNKATSIINAYNQLKTPVSGEPVQWVVLSRRQNGVLLPNAIGYPVTNVSFADFTIDTQRRRRKR